MTQAAPRESTSTEQATSSTPFRLERIGQIAVTAHDLDRAVAFYRDTLGIPLLFQVPRLAFFDCAGQRLLLSLPEKPEFDHPGSILYFSVESARAAHQALAARGVSFIGQPHVVATLGDRDVWMAFFTDTEGNTLAVMSEEPKGAPDGTKSEPA
jgi:methylmalonyl-CoA/ethylmalonyl-CoA epimerase